MEFYAGYAQCIKDDFCVRNNCGAVLLDMAGKLTASVTQHVGKCQFSLFTKQNVKSLCVKA